MPNLAVEFNLIEDIAGTPGGFLNQNNSLNIGDRFFVQAHFVPPIFGSENPLILGLFRLGRLPAFCLLLLDECLQEIWTV